MRRAPPGELARRRLGAQRIAATTFTRPEEAVAWLGAVQAQDYLGALWGVGLRLEEATEEDVERALAERRIVRTWPMRGTLHFVAAEDARWMTALLGPRATARAAGRIRALGRDDAVLARAARALVKGLEGGRTLTRPEAYRTLARAKVPTDGERGIHLLWRLAHDGLLCFGPREGKQQTFVLLDEWLPRAKRLPREEALAELAGRYFRGHGPATVADFAWWSGLTLADARGAIARAGASLAEETIAGERFWFASGAAAPPAAAKRVHLLPAFDELLVGYADRSAALAPADARRVNAGGGILSPTIVVDGRVVGTWRRRLERREIVFVPAPFAELTRPETQAVTRAIERYARFVGLPLRTEPRAPR